MNPVARWWSRPTTAATGRASTAAAQWHIDEQGRYCLVVRWKRGEAEDSCRYIVQTSAGHFAVNALAPLTQKVFRLDIGR